MSQVNLFICEEAEYADLINNGIMLTLMSGNRSVTYEDWLEVTGEFVLWLATLRR
jgi:hypothetical protein